MEALELVEREGLYMIQAVFVEEICLCWALLGEEAKFRGWAEKLLELSQVQDPALAREVKKWLENPQKKVRRWGWRKKERLRKFQIAFFLIAGLLMDACVCRDGKEAEQGSAIPGYRLLVPVIFCRRLLGQ